MTSAQAPYLFLWRCAATGREKQKGRVGKGKGGEASQALSSPARALAHVRGCHRPAGPLAPRHNPTQRSGVGGFTQYFFGHERACADMVARKHRAQNFKKFLARNKAVVNMNFLQLLGNLQSHRNDILHFSLTCNILKALWHLN